MVSQKAIKRTQRGIFMCSNLSNRPSEKTISKWISSRARRMGFQRQDLDDLQQQILLALMDFQFDPERSNGASERTAITSVIDRQLRQFRRTRKRYMGHVAGSEHMPDQVIDSSYGTDQSAHIGMSADLALARTLLSPVEREICDALADGQSVNAIAKNMGMNWHTVKKHVDTIRDCLESLGMDE
jgi:DNA-binding NarL/FixJ family response regulator